MKSPWMLFVCLFAVFLPLPAEEAPSGLTDPNWTAGVLPNGLRYFIRPNAKPENRLELRLVVNAGSVLEDADQQGLAHYLEHMAFNGTENFEKNEMVKFLESLGVGFGPDLNAYTSFDETVYMLRLPTEDPAVVETGYLILADWAGRITNADEAMEAERGVIIEEWRGRRGGEQRIRDLTLPVLFHGSRYAERLPIGILEVLQDFDFDRLRAFYHDWYRPELMSVVAVGNLDVEETRARIVELFSGFESREGAPERPVFEHPPHAETKAGVFHDPEITDSSVMVVWKHPPAPVLTEADYRRAVRQSLITDMLNQRFSEITQRPDAPFLRASGYRGGYTRGGDVFLLHAQVEEGSGAHAQAMRALLAEKERARRFGFSEAEVRRAARRRLRSVEGAYQERDNTEHTVYIREMIRHALEGTFVPGIERELELNREILAEITAAELREMLQSWITEENRVVIADGPSKNGAHSLPAESELTNLFGEVESMTLEAREEREQAESLVADRPEPGEIVAREEIKELGMQIWTLSNGVRVMLKPTPFKQDQVLLSAWSPGGIHALPLEDLPHARAADQAVMVGGLGEFSAVDLRNFLAGRLVQLAPSLGGEQAGLNGSASPRDLETFFELIYLHFTAPRKDAEAFEAHRRRLLQQVRNRLSDPREVFGDTIQGMMSSHHPRLLPDTPESIAAIDLDRALGIYRTRFGNAEGFTFLFTGAVEAETLEPLVTSWLGGLPSKGLPPERSEIEVEIPRHELRHTIRLGLEPISQVRMIWSSDDFEYNYANRYAVQSMMSALRIRAREVLREEMSGTYHVSVWPQISAFPAPRVQLVVQFGCDPQQVEPLIQGVERLVKEITGDLLADSYLQTVRETQRRQREVDLERNEFWNSVLPFYDWHGEDPLTVFQFDELVAGLNAESVRETARRFFRVPDRATFILMPAPEAQ